MSVVDTDLSVSVQVIGPAGAIELEDEANGYFLHSDSFATQTFTHRTIEINSPWLEGTYASDSVLDNTVEALVIWVTGLADDGTYSQYLFRQRLNTLKAVFDQLSYSVIRTIGDAIETWDCEVSDYTVETQQEFIFATRGVLRVPLPHRPSVALTQVPQGGGGGGGGGGGVGSGAWYRIYGPRVMDLDVAFTGGDTKVDGTVLGEWPM